MKNRIFRAIALLIFLGVSWGVFFALDFVAFYPHPYHGGPDIETGGTQGWRVPKKYGWSEADIAYGPKGYEDHLRAVLIRDAGNFVFFRIELANDFALGEGEGKDLIVVFRWGAETEVRPVHFTATKITPDKAWDAELILRDNGSSSLYSAARGEISPTHVQRTFFDRKQARISFSFSKMLLVVAGWNGLDAVEAGILVCRDGGSGRDSVETAGSLMKGRWGTGELRWAADWVRVVEGEDVRRPQ